MLTLEQAKSIMSSGLGKAELTFARSVSAPLYWLLAENGGRFRVRNGTAFFVDAGAGPFGVTAAHVVNGWMSDCNNGKVLAFQIGCDPGIDFSGESRLIDSDDDLDIATFRMSFEEIDSISKVVLTGHQSVWPPKPPELEKGIYFCGYPAIETLRMRRDEISFGAVAGASIVHSVNEFDISTVIERQFCIGVIGKGIPPENYDFRGISGAPMISVVEHKRIRSWRLGGLIYQGPNPICDPSESIEGLEIIKARRADFIKPDGTLDKQRWRLLSRVT